MAAMFTISLMVVMASLLYITYNYVRENQVSAYQGQFERYSLMMSAAPQSVRSTMLEALLTEEKQIGSLSLVAGLFDADKNPTSGNLHDFPAINTAEMTQMQSWEPVVVKGQDQTPTIVGSLFELQDGHWLALGIDTASTQSVNWRVMFASATAILFAVFVVVFSFLIGLFVVSRVNTITDTAQQLMKTGNLSERIPVDSNWDDLGKLVFVLNRMLDKMEANVASIKGVSDSIAHDLRTPLTRLRNQIEDLNQHDDLKDALLNEADSLLSIFNSILRISSIENERNPDQFESISLDDITWDAIELYQPIAEDRGMTISAKLQPVTLTGDRHLLFQSCANLIDNALKFSPDNSSINVLVSSEGDQACITVSDHGTGISPENRSQVLRRLFREDQSRNTPGSGLGLALVAAVVELHRGTITIDDNTPGTIVTLTLPLTQPVV